MQLLDLIALAALSLAPCACVFTIGDGSDSASGTDTTAVPATEPATTSTTAGTTTGATDSDATTPTEAAASTSSTPTTAAADSTTTSADTTGGSDTGPAGGACGWVDEQNIYACGGMGEDPDGFIPIECAEPPVEDAPCDGDQGPIADPGCCSDGVNAYCYLGKLVVTICR